MMNHIDACFIGLGYIGLPTAIVAASRGLKIHGMDINQSVVEIIQKGKIHIVEPGLEELCKGVVTNGNLSVGTHIKKANVYVVVVPTPFKGDHEPDISYVQKAIEGLIPSLKEEDLVIIESTSPIGTTKQMAKLIFLHRPELKDKIYMAYCPERVLPGNVIFELKNNDRVIGGVDKVSSEKAADFYRKFVDGKLHLTNAQTAEMCKLTENAFRDTEIAFANELSIICENNDVDVWELIELANRHPRVNILQPGCGVGGHCIAVDPWFLVSAYPLKTQMISTARKVNNYKAFWCEQQVYKAVKEFEQKNNRIPSIAVMGLAFKPNIDDLRESPALSIAMKLIEKLEGYDIHIVEPNIEEHKVFTLSDPQKAYDCCDIVVFLVKHEPFMHLKYDANKTTFDFCGVLPKKEHEVLSLK